MASETAEKKIQLITKVTQLLGERLREDGPLAARFAQNYCDQAYADELLAFAADDLYGALLSHWNLARHRAAGQSTVRVYNPNFDEHGWRSTHTAVEVVSDDLPFLVDSVIMALNRRGVTVHVIIHPVIPIKRSDDGEVRQVFVGGAESSIPRESLIHCQIDRQASSAGLRAIEDEIAKALNDVAVAVADWGAMRSQMVKAHEELVAGELLASPQDVVEVRAFLDWVVHDHFTFLGYREYRLDQQQEETVLLTEPQTGLGILREQGLEDHVSASFAELPPRLRALAWSPELVTLSKASARSTVHRPSHLDYIGVKRFDEKGRVIGEHRFLGLYTHQAYSLRPMQIPLLRHKVQAVLDRSQLITGGHAYRTLQYILDAFPRDDLFQADVDELYAMAMGILKLQERSRLKLFIRVDRFERFVSCLVYVPRERYNTALRERMEHILMVGFNGLSATFTTQFSESVLARVQLHIRTQPGDIPEFSTAELEALLVDAMLSWDDALAAALLESQGESQGNALLQRYASAFPPAYKDDFNPRTAVGDILRLEVLSGEQPLNMHLYRPPEEPHGPLRFKLYGTDQPMALSQVLPMLERLGLTVLTTRPYTITAYGGVHLWIVEFTMVNSAVVEVDVAQVKDIFQDAFARVWRGQMENDAFNWLVLGAGLPWRDVVMLRAYGKYMRQIRMPFSQDYIQQTLITHPAICQLLVQLFHARFDPKLAEEDRKARSAALETASREAIQGVASLDEDRILGRYLDLILATLRCNFFQPSPKPALGHGTDHPFKDYLAFKFDPHQIPELPLPRPMFEIFVYSPRVEGVHLRGGPAARGGLRWSDRREDFRTEVLGLMKAQMVKNAVIVPVGSKGGFVVKRPPSERPALQQEVEACYQTFISGLLDLTDNRRDGETLPPPEVVRYDGDDPYLVVAADKGTATFSDLANAVAAQYDFWLGDAFASGGAQGYDHKKMGITARGAWESVKRHFRELGLDIQNRDDFTVLGIGDMGGDVFGNGMLLSTHIKLVAAFNHLHIFLDPDPDPAVSHRERQRLFALPRSSWSDYDANLISPGGGIYLRTAKTIPLSPQVKARFGLRVDSLTPTQLIHALLKAQVDLLWNGGIGTYVKAGSETHNDVGDKANDALRIDGAELGARVVGEGGNLGLTQLGRIEYAQKGGKVFTDAIDNCGGVNCSDHEVNIKILLAQVVGQGDMTEKQRNQLLAAMTDEVAGLVLRQNYLQPQAISLTASIAPKLLGGHARVIRALERAGLLDRTLEYLPSDEEIQARGAAGKGLTAPELAVLLAHGKIHLFQALIASDVPEDPYLQRDLMMYFPTPLRERFAEVMGQHPLGREIIATFITNSVLNRMGSAFVFQVQEDVGADIATIARAYTAAREIFAARVLWREIEALDNQVPAAVQGEMHLYTRRLLERACVWLLRRRRPPLAIEAIYHEYQPGVADLAEALSAVLAGDDLATMEAARLRWVEQGAPEALAQRVVSLEALYSALDIIDVARDAELPPQAVALIYFRLASVLHLNWLRASINGLKTENHWQVRAQAAQLSALYDHTRELTAEVLKATANSDTPDKRLEQWLERKGESVERCLGVFADLRASDQLDVAMLSVALRELNQLALA